MNKYSKAILAILLLAAIGAAAFFLLQNQQINKSLLTTRAELTKTSSDLSDKTMQMAELNKQMTQIREGMQKRINALELSALEKEAQMKTIREEVDSLKKDKDTSLVALQEKDSKITDLTRQISSLEIEKDVVYRKISDLEKRAAGADLLATRAATNSAALSAPSQRTTGYSNNTGAIIDPVNLGEIIVSSSAGSAVRVQEVNPVYDYVVINAGSDDGLRKGAIINIVRDNQIICKATLHTVRGKTAAAILVPESKKSPVSKGDIVTLS